MRSFAPLAMLVGLSACAADPEVIAPDAAVFPDLGVLDRPTTDVAPLDARPDALDATLDRAPLDVARPDVPDVTDAAPDADAMTVRCATGLDSDGDGLTNDAECAAGTDPFNADSDMDGASDGAEARYPRVCVATDRARQRRPPVACTADAGCMTGERCLGLDPRRPDSDGDGVTDGAEDPDANGRIEVARGETDPRLWDTDGDGTNDGMSGLAICRPDGLATVT